MSNTANVSQYAGSTIVVVAGLTESEWSVLFIFFGFVIGIAGFMVNYFHKKLIRASDKKHKKAMFEQDKKHKEKLIEIAKSKK